MASRFFNQNTRKRLRSLGKHNIAHYSHFPHIPLNPCLIKNLDSDQRHAKARRKINGYKYSYGNRAFGTIYYCGIVVSASAGMKVQESIP
ncbi:hypothetical protein E2P81_ATG02898 [Venturia nashicola]|nr:hypothetical protein E2P81_ATG02898 [Venturia nashicola]